MAIQYLTQERLEKLKQELQDLKTNGRREAASRIEAAKALGDLSENAEYHEAKDALALIEGRIYEIDEILKNAQLIEGVAEGAGDAVRVGSSVDLEVGGKQKSFTIVGSNEADPTKGKISNESPIGSALLGARVGDDVEVKTPTGVTTYRVVAVR